MTLKVPAVRVHGQSSAFEFHGLVALPMLMEPLSNYQVGQCVKTVLPVVTAVVSEFGLVVGDVVVEFDIC